MTATPPKAAGGNAYPGLTDIEVAESRRLNGSNVLTPAEPVPWYRQFLANFATR